MKVKLGEVGALARKSTGLIKTKLKRKRHTPVGRCGPSKTVMYLGACAAGFVTGLSEILGFPSYMCAAAASLAGDCSIGVFMGVVFACLVRRSFEDCIVQLCAVLVLTALRAIDPLGPRRDDPIYMSLLNTGVLMLFSCVMTVAMPADLYIASMRMINSLLSGCTVFIARMVMISRERTGTFEMSGMNGVFLGQLFIMAVSVMSSVNIFSVNLGRTFGVFVLLQAVRRYRSSGGAVVGALSACGVMICEPSLARNTLLMSTAGLICGAFVHFGTLTAVLSFLVAALISLVAVGVNADTYRCFADLVAGSLLFIAVPASAVKRSGKYLSGFRSSLEIVGQTTSSRLRLAGEALGEIRKRLDTVSAAMDRKTASKTTAGEVQRCVCADCPSYRLCFETGEDMARRLSDLGAAAERRGQLTEAEVRLRLRACARPALMTRAFNEFCQRLEEERAENIRVRELRGLLCEQLSSMEDILDDLSFRSSQVRSIDPMLSGRLREHFVGLGHKNARTCVYVDENLCRRADVYINEELRADRVKLTAAVSSIMDCDMCMPDVHSADGLTRISFAELPAYEAAVASFTASAGGEYSGDSFEVFELNGCEKYVLLSDGMGTGKRARLDSVFTVSLAQKLICAGLSMTTAHRLINSMLRVKGWEESFATLDLLKIDLSGGAAVMLKSGAVQSRLCRDGSFIPVGGQAFPAGILPSCSADVSHIKLFEGDIIVMTSDGADDDTADELAALAADCPDLDVNELSEKLGRHAMRKREGKRSDDLTIIVIKVVHNKEI